MISISGGMRTQEQVSHGASSDSALVEKFRTKLLGARSSLYQSQPWVMVTPIQNANALLSVYQSLKDQGIFDDWPRAFFEVRQNAGICVFALLPVSEKNKKNDFSSDLNCSSSGNKFKKNLK